MDLTIEPKEDETETEMQTEAPTEAVTESITETQTEAPAETEAYTEAQTEAPTESVTEAPAETEAWTEAPTETESQTEAQTETWTEAPVETEAWTEAPTESESSAEAPAEDEPVSETDDQNSLIDAPGGSGLLLPEKMEVGKAYQLQYEISNEDWQQPEEASVSYSVEEGSDLVDMPDKSGNFTVEAEGTVAFQVNVMLANGTELQAYEQGETVPADPTDTETDAPSIQPADENNQQPVVSQPEPENPETHWYDGMNLAINTPGSGEGSLAVGSDYPLGYTLTAADGSLVSAEQIPQGVKAIYTVSDTNLAEIVTAEDGSQFLRVKEAGSFSLQVSLDGLTSAAVTYTSARSSAAELVSFTVGDITAAPENGEIHITLPCNSALDPAGITPVITVSDKATVSPASETVLDFSDGAAKTLTVTAEDGVTVKTYQVTVTKAAHSFGEWTVSKEATCTEAGEETRTCSVCGATETQAISAKGHTASEKWVTTKKATCTEKGTQVQKCTVCGVVVNTRETKALGHNWRPSPKSRPAPRQERNTRSVRDAARSKIKRPLKLLAMTGSKMRIPMQMDGRPRLSLRLPAKANRSVPASAAERQRAERSSV